MSFLDIMFDNKIIPPNGPQYMSDTPAPRYPGPDDGLPGGPAGPGDHPWLGSPDWTLVPQSPDWDQAWLAARDGDEDPGDPDEYEDPDNAPPPGMDDDELAALIAEAREVTAGQAYAAELAARTGHTAVLAAAGAVSAGRRGPGMPGSAQSFPGEYASRAAGFATAKPLDLAPGCAVLASFLEDTAGDDGRYAGASDDELLGVICAWDRAEAAMAAGKHAAVAELISWRKNCIVIGVTSASLAEPLERRGKDVPRVCHRSSQLGHGVQAVQADNEQVHVDPTLDQAGPGVVDDGRAGVGNPPVLHLAGEPVGVRVIAYHQRPLGHAGLAPEPDLSSERDHAF